MVMNVAQRRDHNRKLALRLAAAGIAIFPSSGKTPLIPGWTKLDEVYSRTDYGTVFNAYKEKNGEPPFHVGATLNSSAIVKLWKKFPDAVPSISCGANDFLVLDADTKRNGPEQLKAWMLQNGLSLDDYPVTLTQSGGLHVFFQNDIDSPLGNAAGAFFDLGVDVRGAGGQVVAPGSIREDGKSYRSREGSCDLLTSAPPPIPECVKAMIAARPKNKTSISSEDERAAIERLATQDWPSFEDLTDSTLGRFDLDALVEKDDEFAGAISSPDEDKSKARFTLAKCLHREYGDALDVLDFAALLEHFNDETDGAFGIFVGDDKPSTGEYSLRSIARDFLRSKNDFKVSDGSAFSAVDDGDDDAPPAHYLEAKEEQKQKKKALRLRLATELAHNWTPVEWLVKNVLPARGLGLLVGDANIGKSFLALDLADKLTQGSTWLDQPSKQAGVLYVPGEGANSVSARVRAIEVSNGVVGNFGVADDGNIQFFLDGENAVKKVIEAAREYEAASGFKVGLVILDTLASVAPGMDENTAKDIGIVLGHARKIEHRLKCAVLIVHHLGKNKDNGVRGSSALRGNTDFVLMAEEKKRKDKGLGAYLRIDKNRDGEKGVTLPFRLETVVIGQDVSWNPDAPEDIKSCVIVTPTESLGDVEDEDAADLGEPPKSADAPSMYAVVEEGEVDKETKKAELEERCAVMDTRRDLLSLLVADQGQKLKGVEDGGWTKLLSLIERLPAVKSWKEEDPKNFSSKFRLKIFDNQPEIMFGNKLIRTRGHTRHGMLVRVDPIPESYLSKAA